MSLPRLDALLEEVGHLYWDVIILTETWRGEVREEFRLEAGHIFYGSGGKQHSRGVGFLVHARHGRCSFEPINERLASIDLSIGSRTLRIFGTYMPHSKHPDEDVEIIYETLQELLLEARRKKCSCIVAGDFNAQVGHRQEHDDFRILGQHAFQERNPRGEWLLQWCTSHSLVVGNTFFDSSDSGAWTYRNGSLHLQNDYILFDMSLFKKVRTSKVCPEIDTGSDHRPVLAVLRNLEGPMTRSRHCKRDTSSGPVDKNDYKAELHSLLAVCGSCAEDSAAKQTMLEQIMVQAYKKSRTPLVRKLQVDKDTLRIRDLIGQRRHLGQLQGWIEQSELDSRRRRVLQRNSISCAAESAEFEA